MKQHDIIAAREVLLKRIRNAQLEPTDNSSDGLLPDEELFVSSSEGIEMQFAEALLESGGAFYYADTEMELRSALHALIHEKAWKRIFCKNMDLVDYLVMDGVSIEPDSDNLLYCEALLSECEFLSARTGSVVLSSALSGGRRAVAMNDVMIIIAHISQIQYDIPDVFKALMQKYDNVLPSSVSFVTGPSRTSDIEKTLVIGAHGSKEIYVFLTGFDFSEG